ncbi:MAG TPA: ATP-binding protein, partial [Burkholderiaceae bacterium]|nr:ATP-binding protein [Burkholderiaceae bacterium]
MLHQFAADIFPSEAPLEAAAMHELLAFTRAASAIHLADTPDGAGAVAPATAVDRAPASVAGLPAPATAAPSMPARTVAVSEPVLDEQVLAHHLPVLPVASAVEVVPPAPIRDELDADLLEVFLTEANDLLPAVGANLRALAGDHGNQNVARELMRQLHTIKGSARMAGAMRLGDCVHHMETRIEESMTAPLVPTAVVDDLQSRYDQAMTLFDELVHPQPPAPEASAEDDAESTVVATSSAPSPDIVVPGPIVVPLPAPSFPPTMPAPSFPPTFPPTMPAGVAPAAPAFTSAAVGPRVPPAAVDAPAASVSTAMPGAPGAAQTATYVRVRADVLDKLVDQAGEVSIARSKVENEISTLRTALTDLTENISRLRTQLREVEIQAESQIQTHSDKLDKASAQFDPLEFDRYTRLQELTRLLAESVEDVAMVQSNMLKGLQMADGDLTAQMRLTRELQQQLMRVRLVPFANIGERLYRVARQSAKELGKRVNLEIKGGTVEIDRGVLERMSGPFEHLVRNCIVHGLEMPTDRGHAGKAETGEIAIEVRQEGNEIIAVVNDDGAGLNLPRIRTRAIERRLIGADQHLSDKELIELIFAPGFSTAESVTELAGRGVGMDVVRAELGGFGGRIAVSSEAGRGTRFTLYMPLTLAVTQVVLATVGGRRYAIPAGMVEQVRRLRPTFLSEALAQGSIDLPPVGDVVLRPLAQLLGEPVNMH